LYTQQAIEDIITYTKTSRPEHEGGAVSYPGENTLRDKRKEFERRGFGGIRGFWGRCWVVRGLFCIFVYIKIMKAKISNSERYLKTHQSFTPERSVGRRRNDCLRP